MSGSRKGKSSSKENKKQQALLNSYLQTYEAQYNKPKGGNVFFIGKTKNGKVAGMFVSYKRMSNIYERDDNEYILSNAPVNIEEDEKNRGVYVFGRPKYVSRFFDKTFGKDVNMSGVTFYTFADGDDISNTYGLTVEQYSKSTLKDITEDLKKISSKAARTKISLNDIFEVNSKIGSTKHKTKIIDTSDRDRSELMKRPVIPTVKRTKTKFSRVPTSLQSKVQFITKMIKDKEVTSDNLRLMNVTNYSRGSTDTIPVATRNLKVDKATDTTSYRIAEISDGGVIKFKPGYFSIADGLNLNSSENDAKKNPYLYTYVRLTKKDNPLRNYFYILEELFALEASFINKRFSKVASALGEGSLAKEKYDEYIKEYREENEDDNVNDEEEEDEDLEDDEVEGESENPSNEEEESENPSGKEEDEEEEEEASNSDDDTDIKINVKQKSKTKSPSSKTTKKKGEK